MLPTQRRSSFEGASAGSRAWLVALWVGLVALGVAGRLWQPGWNVTPMAAVALAAGASFASPLVAASVPLVALAIGNLALPGYGSPAMAAVVYVATAWPVLLGGLVRRGGWPAILGGAVANSLVFFVTTNLAHWLLTTDYPRTAAGLGACFVAALPFYRWMPVGDVAWTAAVFGGLAALQFMASGRPAACAVARDDRRPAGAVHRLD